VTHHVHMALWTYLWTTFGVVTFLILFKLIAFHFRNTLLGQAYLTVM
jgi:hypothetical protein